LASEFVPVGAHTSDNAADDVCFGRTRHSFAATTIHAKAVVGAADVELPTAYEG
jgi:hypothetical protein